MTGADAVKQLLDHVDAMIGYWASEGQSNVPEATSKREALEGLAFSLLVMLDGDALDAPALYLAPVSDAGEVGDPVNGELHEVWSARRRKEASDGT